MADIQHAVASDPNIHEPKNISTANAGEVYVADGAGSGDWTASTDLALPTGWENYIDSTYTTGSPLSLSAGVRTKITIDGLATGTDTSQSPGATLWDTTNNKIMPILSGDAYHYRFKLEVDPSSTSGTMDIELDVGGTAGVILRSSRAYLKGTNTQELVFDSMIYAGTDFVANGAEIYLTSDINAGIHDMAILITRVHRAN